MKHENKANILLVDDRPENLLALEAILENEEYCLMKASSGEEALKYLLKYDFATILLDVQMPGMDGFSTAKIIKSRERSKNIPILFITANYMDSTHIFTGYSIGAIDYILKPIDPIVLQAKVAGFVNLYRLNQKLVYQAEMLEEKTKELEKTCSELSKITSDLRVSEALANVISETTTDSMVIMNSSGTILKANPAVKAMFQYEQSELLGKSIYKLLNCEQARKNIREVLEQAYKSGNARVSGDLREVNAVRKDGTLFPAELHIGVKYVQNDCIIACTIRDITQKKKTEEIIKHLAYYDGLTDLPNRIRFRDQLNLELNQAKKRHRPLVLLHLDIDRLKYVNDSLGHLMGDRLIREFAVRLKECVREKDFIARCGGDEFNILLPNTDRETGIEIADNILKGIQQPFYIDEYELYVTASMGISVYPYDGEDANALLKNAGAALFRAKESGPNQYKIFSSGMNLQSYRTFVLQNDLRRAIERKEFSLIFQPRVNMKTGMVTGVEALLRWNHPNLGSISPGEFIPLAEGSGQIIGMGEWVLRYACAQLRAWREAGLPPVRIAVNFSAQQFMQKDLIGNIRRILSDTQIPPELIEIEITESVILKNEKNIINTLMQINEMGIWLSVDDFGTGYSSLNYLRRYPVNFIKIDKSFVQDLSYENSNSTALVSAIITMAHNLQMSVVAEGVESMEQFNILQRENCDEIQGYLLSPPVPAKEIEVLVAGGHPYLGKAKTGIYTVAASETAQSVSFDELNPQKSIEMALQYMKKTYSLSPQEMELFRLIVDGLTNREIAEKLMISRQEAKERIWHLYEKIHVNDRIQTFTKVYQVCAEVKKTISGSDQLIGEQEL